MGRIYGKRRGECKQEIDGDAGGGRESLGMHVKRSGDGIRINGWIMFELMVSMLLCL